MKEICWQPYHLLSQAPSASLADWLRDPGSFMQRLKNYGIAAARIQVLKQGWGFPTLAERKILNIPDRHYALVREVLIDSVQGKWMFARTVFPASTLTGSEQQFARLKNRSLGSLLFKNPSMLRSEFHFARLHTGMPWHEKITSAAQVNSKELWARNSVFHIKDKPLLLTEVFFPEIAALKND